MSSDEPDRERSPEEIRRDIDATRADMDATIDQIEDRVSPSKIRQRQANRARSRWQRIRESVMGSAHTSTGQESRGSAARERARDTAESARQAPEAVSEQTRGNPLAAGLIAFGLGALAGSLFPASRQERQASQQLRERFEEPVKQEAQRVGQETKEELRPAAQRAMDQTKESAREAAERTRDDAQSSVQEIKQDQGSGPGPSDYHDYTVEELRQMASDRGVAGRSSMTKEELIQALSR